MRLSPSVYICWLSSKGLFYHLYRDRSDCSTSETANKNVTQRITCQPSVNQRINIFAASTAFAVVTNFVATILFYFLMMNASRVLHNSMFACILRTPVLFFDTNPSGKLGAKHQLHSSYLMRSHEQFSHCVLTTNMVACKSSCYHLYQQYVRLH